MTVISEIVIIYTVMFSELLFVFVIGPFFYLYSDVHSTLLFVFVILGPLFFLILGIQCNIVQCDYAVT